jgi:two-component system response regulator YesN
MPYSLVIVDDEKPIREGLSKHIDWKALGLEVTGCFDDGREAIDFINLNVVDVVFTDIKMNLISGLEIAKYIYLNRLKTKVIIISGFKEFEFAREAIDYGVEDYILKPIRFDEVNRVFKKLKMKFDSEAKNQLNTEAKEKQLYEIVTGLKQQLLTDIFSRGLSDKSFIDTRIKLIEDGHQIINSRFYLFHVILDERHENDLVKEQISNCLSEIFQKAGTGIETYQVGIYGLEISCISMLSKKINNQDSNLMMEQYYEDIKIRLKMSLNYEVRISQCDCFESVYKISPPEHWCSAENNSSPVIKNMKEKKKELICLLAAHNLQSSLEGMDAIINSLDSGPIYDVHDFIMEFFIEIFNRFIPFCLGLKNVKQQKLHYNELSRLSRIEQIKAWASDLIKDILAELDSQDGSASESAISRSIKYINVNYGSDISLYEVANKVYLNTAYFSRLFKQKTGQNFIDYLTDLRIKKAIEILAGSNYKTAKVAKMVGIKDSKYFARLFKRHTGYSPTSYVIRNMGRNTDE